MAVPKTINSITDEQRNGIILSLISQGYSESPISPDLGGGLQSISNSSNSLYFQTEAQEMHAAIRGWLREAYDAETAAGIPILYGGSCKPGNADELFACADVDGGLIGGAALEPDSFRAIIDAAGRVASAKVGVDAGA